MKNIIKNERGVSLVSLAVAIIILGIITSMLLYNVKDTKDIERVSNMYIDIEGITDRVSNYYSRYGALPVLNNIDLSTDSTISNWISERDSENNEGPLGKNDSDTFYVIDLEALENLSLNYGSGFNRNALPSDKDVYVINANSHNIFYLHGIRVNNNGVIKMYYTNQDKDTEAVDIRYVAGIKIPDGFIYKSGDTKNNLKVEKVVTSGTNIEYTWANTADSVYTLHQSGNNYSVVSPNEDEDDEEENTTSITFATGQSAEDLIASAKEFGGFYYDASGNINYFSISEDDNWGPVYDVTGTYTDRNGDKAYIPAGFKISKLSSLNTINKGLVIKNDSTGDEYVWIDVPDNVLANARTLDEIETALKNYSKDYREEGYEDTWYDGCGYLNKSDYYDLKNKMLQSIKENSGFYIGRYEAGTDKARTSGDATEKASVISTTNGYGNPLSQKDKYPYNYVTVSQAQGLSQMVKPEGADYETSLMFGIQWDLVCKFIEETGNKTFEQIAKDSKEWANCLNSEFYITSENALYINVTNRFGTSPIWNTIAKETKKEANGQPIMLTTGASNQNSVLNIYDFIGNEGEITLMHYLNNSWPVCIRGRYFLENGNNYFYDWATKSTAYMFSSFRVTLFK